MTWEVNLLPLRRALVPVVDDSILDQMDLLGAALEEGFIEVW